MVAHMSPTAAITGPAKRETPETPNSQYQYLVLAKHPYRAVAKANLQC